MKVEDLFEAALADGVSGATMRTVWTKRGDVIDEREIEQTAVTDIAPRSRVILTGEPDDA